MVIANVGDVNNDGVEDFAIGCPECSSVGSAMMPQAGVVAFIYAGSQYWSNYSSSALPTSINLGDIETLGLGFLVSGHEPYMQLGIGVTTGADCDGDNMTDILMASLNTSDGHSYTHLVYMQHPLPAPGPDRTLLSFSDTFVGKRIHWHGHGNDIEISNAMVIMDINGDGLGDVFIGDPINGMNMSSGAVHMLWGIQGHRYHGEFSNYSSTNYSGPDQVNLLLNTSRPKGCCILFLKLHTLFDQSIMTEIVSR